MGWRYLKKLPVNVEIIVTTECVVIKATGVHWIATDVPVAGPVAADCVLLWGHCPLDCYVHLKLHQKIIIIRYSSNLSIGSRPTHAAHLCLLAYRFTALVFHEVSNKRKSVFSFTIVRYLISYFCDAE